MISAFSLSEDLTEFSALTLLALIQGLTEFLPISSSGHLVLAQNAMGYEEPELVLDIALHVGTLFAVLVVYRARLFELIAQVCRFDFREVGLLAVGTLPAAVVGVCFKDEISALFRDPRFATSGLLITACILLVGERARRRNLALLPTAPAGPDEEAVTGSESVALSWKQALLIGCAQAVAIIPGISRSGSTIAAGLLCGQRAPDAARFSFLLSIPAILGAAALSLPDAFDQGRMGNPVLVIWAAAFAGFVGWGALRMLLAFLGRGAFAWFAVYCSVLGIGAWLFYAVG